MYVSKLLHLEAVVLTVLLLLQYSCILFADDSSDESTQKGPQRTGILIRQLKPRRHRPNSDESCPTCSSNRKPLPPSPDFVAIDQNIATETRRKPSKSSSGGVGGALRDWVIERDDTAEVPKKTKENIQSSPNSQIEDKNSGSTSVNQMAGGGQQEPDDGGEQPGGGQKTGDKSDSDETKIDDTTRDTDDTTTAPQTPTQDPTILPTVPGCPRKDPHFPLKNASVCFTKPPSPDNAKCECQMKPPCVSFIFPELGTKQQQWPSLPNIPIELKKINRMSDVVGINSSAPKNICSYVIVMTICILVCFICTLWQHR